MSESSPTTMPRPARRPADRGMTLPELLIAVAIIGLMMTVLSSAVIVTIRQEDSTSGRFNVARAEQNVGMWLPGDLASAAVVTVDPAATPCDRKEVDGEWVPTGQVVPGPRSPARLERAPGRLVDHRRRTATPHGPTSAYYFAPGPNGLFELTRIECTSTGGAWTCDEAGRAQGPARAARRYPVDPRCHQARLGDPGQRAARCRWCR